MADSGSSLSPEKRLLQLIEASGKGGAVSAAAAAATASTSAAPAASAAQPKKTVLPQTPAPKAMPAIRLSIYDVKAISTEWLNLARKYAIDFKKNFGLKTANQTARIILVVLVIFTVINAAFEMRAAAKDPLAGLDVAPNKLMQIDMQNPGFDPSVIKKSEARNVFLPFAKREELAASVKPDSHSAKLAELTKTLKLTGISYDPDNIKAAYCMIEDLQKNITVFLHIGDQVSGMKLTNILEESVEFEYENEKIQLH